MNSNIVAQRAPACSQQTGKSAAFLLTAMLMSSAMWSSNAYADGASAARYLWANMERAGLTYNMNLSDVIVEPIFVRGMYAVKNRQGQLISITNESGTLSGDGHELLVFPLGGGAQRPFTAEEMADFRAEVMANIDYDKFMKVQYGDGGGRKLIMFSSVDCGYCNKLEGALAKNSRTLNTTFYVIPGSLRSQAQGGLPALQTVSRIMCAPKPELAWREFWAKRTVPADRACAITPTTIERDEELFKHVLLGAGIKVSGSPTMLNENGDQLLNVYDMNAVTGAAVYGPNSRPQLAMQKPARWIVSPSEASAQDQIAAAQAPVRVARQQPQQQTGGKISTKDLLKKLFK